jgi:hypothetical protein
MQASRTENVEIDIDAPIIGIETTADYAENPGFSRRQ